MNMPFDIYLPLYMAAMHYASLFNSQIEAMFRFYSIYIFFIIKDDNIQK